MRYCCNICPICGYDLGEEYAIGEICPCCFNESDFDDDILYDELDRFCDADFLMTYLKKEDFGELRNIKPEPAISIEIAHSLLRAEWIRKGYKWYSDEDRPNDWSVEKAKKQLENLAQIKY